MLKKIQGLFSSIAKEVGVDMTGAGIGHVLLTTIFGGKKNDNGDWEVSGVVSFLKESFKGENVQDAVRILRTGTSDEKVDPRVLEAYERLYGDADLAGRERMERSLGKFLGACRHEIGGEVAIKKIVEEWNRENGRQKEGGKKITEVPHLPSTDDGDKRFVDFFNSFLNEDKTVDEATMHLYFEMLDPASWQRWLLSEVGNTWDQVVASPAWKKAVRWTGRYLVVLASLLGITALFTGATLFLGVEQAQFLGVAYFFISASLIGILFVFAYPLREALYDIHQLLQEKNEESRWEEWIAHLPSIIGSFAFLMMFLMLVPYKDHPQYLVILLFAGITVVTLQGLRQIMAWTAIVVVTLIVSQSSILSGFDQTVLFVEEQIYPRAEVLLSDPTTSEEEIEGGTVTRVSVEGPLISSLSVSTTEFKGFPIPDGWAVRTPDPSGCARVRMTFSDKTQESATDCPGSERDRISFSQDKEPVYIEYLSLEDDGFILDPITWYKCGTEGERPCP